MLQKDTASDRYSAASGLGSAIGDAAKGYGIDLTPIYAALDIDPAIFTDMTGRISLDRLCRLLETCALITKDDTFGLKSTDQFKAGSTGPYGFGLMAAPTPLDFFKFISDHQNYASEKSYSKLTIND